MISQRILIYYVGICHILFFETIEMDSQKEFSIKFIKKLFEKIILLGISSEEMTHKYEIEKNLKVQVKI